MNSEYYVVSIIKTDPRVENPALSILGGEKFYVIIKDRKELSELYALMPSEYRVEAVAVLNESKNFEAFRKELVKNDDNKPEGLNFGE